MNTPISLFLPYPFIICFVDRALVHALVLLASIVGTRLERLCDQELRPLWVTASVISRAGKNYEHVVSIVSALCFHHLCC